jgi:hypothetical protein
LKPGQEEHKSSSIIPKGADCEGSTWLLSNLSHVEQNSVTLIYEADWEGIFITIFSAC